ncbi:CGNR zinc finger domain-containing protein [Amycolatopsis magusensis]|uniref:CGNR zinc finger domain-containing protein n=1 Tax=Amycolatopsis magusensis TaxID=882444 RepID=UPI0024A9CCB3|nr:ABATE domain-containing protein [Amycolatopsis magusensis]MDI5979952.1 ABATE domain-containing protein [Amycolatopsis magusensis]
MLALELATTVRYGPNGVLDVLETVDGLVDWLREQDLPEVPVDERVRESVVAVRKALRSLFADAVRPGPPSKADANRLLDPATAARQLNEAAAAVPRVPVLDWPDGRMRYRPTEADPAALLTAELAKAGIEFLSGPDRERLRACPAPRCVRYFVQDHPRQAWCKPSCGNRARVSRHYHRHQ